MPSTSATTRQDLRATGVRRRTLRIAAAGLTAAAALTLTACGGQDDGALKTGAAKPYHPASQNAPGTDAQGTDSANKDTGATGARNAARDTAQGARDGAGQGNGTRTDNAGSRPAPTAPGSQDAARHTSCDATKIQITAKPLKRPVNHLMLQATNTSGATCDLYAFPYLGFGDEPQSPLAEFPDSKPQAVVTLAPGESGYAGVATSSADGSGGNGRQETKLSVSMHGRNGNGSVGGAARVALPGGSVYLDDSARVTYWQADPNDAAAW